MRPVVLMCLMAAACAAPPAMPPPSPSPPAVTRVAPSRDYPLEKCVVSEMPLDSQGDRRAVVYRGVELRVCCKTCQGKVEAEPEPWLRRFQDWIGRLKR